MKPQPLFDEAEHLAVQQVLPWHGTGTLSATEQAMVARHLATCAACRADVALQRQVTLAEPALPDGLDAEAALARLMPQLDGVAQDAAPLDYAMPGAALSGMPPQIDAVDSTDRSRAGAAGNAGTAPQDTRIHAAAGVVEHARGAPEAVAGARAGAGAGSGSAAAPGSGWMRRLMDALDTFDGGGWRNWALAAQCAVIAGLGVLLWPADGGQDGAYRALGSGTAALPALAPAPAPDVVVMFQPDAQAGHMQRVLQASGARIVDGPTVTGAYLIDVDAARMPQLLATLRADPAVRLAEPLGAGAGP